MIRYWVYDRLDLAYPAWREGVAANDSGRTAAGRKRQNPVTGTGLRRELGVYGFCSLDTAAAIRLSIS